MCINYIVKTKQQNLNSMHDYTQVYQNILKSIKMADKKITTIKLNNETKKRLDNLKEYERETYDELINKVLNIINISIKNPLSGARIFKNIKRKKLGKQKLHDRIIARQQTQQELESDRLSNSNN